MTPKLRYRVLSSILLMSARLVGQNDLSIYGLNNLFQQTYVNPAYLPKSNVQVGLPVMSSVYLNAQHSGFSYGQLLGSGSSSIDPERIAKALGKRNILSVDFQTDLFSLGIKSRRTYFSVSLTEKVHTNFIYPKTLASFFLQGNGDPSTLGKRVSFDDLGFNLKAYHELAFGVSMPVTRSLRVGARFKYLMGLVNVQTKRSTLGITTDPDTYALTVDGGLLVRTAGIQQLTGPDAENDLVAYVSKPQSNSGFGIDLGVEYSLTPKLSFQGSLINLGSIRWKTDAVQYEQTNIRYTFDAVDLDDLTGDGFGTEMQARIDSLSSLLNLQEKREAYSTGLNPIFIAGTRFQLNESNAISGLVRLEWIERFVRPSLAAFYHFGINNWLGANFMYSYQNRSAVNLGGAFTVKFLPFQWYIATDNFLVALSPQLSKTAQIRTGINFVFGGKQLKKIKMPKFEKES
ncbi:MAG TPA: DUF5723 family protein [Luteibaculaceae bacterium]|nr:DUF5723 family protein [Luteibaculaceae bacterium]